MPRQTRSISQSLNNNTTTKSLLQEPEVARLQRDIDNYTRKVELERRRYFNLSSMNTQLKQESLDRNKNVADLKKEQINTCQKKDVAALKSLQKQTNQYNAKYDQSLSAIEEIRSQIDMLRKQRSQCLSKVSQMDNELKDAEQTTTNIQTEIKSKQKRSYNTQHQMYMLKTKNEEEKTNYQSQFESLQDQVKRERHERDKMNKSFQERRDSYETFDTSSILRRRLQRLILNNKEKVKIIDAYQRNMRIIDEGFNQIKEATGLTDIEEIQSNFIKSEEQNYALLTYLDILNQEIDNIEDLNSELEIKCTEQERDNVERNRILQATPDDEKRKRRMQNVIDEKKSEIGVFQKNLNELQPMFQDLLNRLGDSRFNVDHHSTNNYTDGFQLNEGNIDAYLSDLDGFANQILLYKSKKNQTGMFFTSTILVDEVPYKDFKTKNIPIMVTQQQDDVVDQQKLMEPARLRQQALDFLEKKSQPQPGITTQVQSTKKADRINRQA